ncbi:MAG: hypothetical protein R3234_07170, partial [Thermoanaerobaculia bacterium]|nr:hypothetical protein [Thermoanaerobaculia bacterium]
MSIGVEVPQLREERTGRASRSTDVGVGEDRDGHRPGLFIRCRLGSDDVHRLPAIPLLLHGRHDLVRDLPE